MRGFFFIFPLFKLFIPRGHFPFRPAVDQHRSAKILSHTFRPIQSAPFTFAHYTSRQHINPNGSKQSPNTLWLRNFRYCTQYFKLNFYFLISPLFLSSILSNSFNFFRCVKIFSKLIITSKNLYRILMRASLLC